MTGKNALVFSKGGVPEILSAMLEDQDANVLRLCSAKVTYRPRLSEKMVSQQNHEPERSLGWLILYIGITSCDYKISQLGDKSNMENCTK
jgi:hypothetical protein